MGLSNKVGDPLKPRSSYLETVLPFRGFDKGFGGINTPEGYVYDAYGAWFEKQSIAPFWGIDASHRILSGPVAEGDPYYTYLFGAGLGLVAMGSCSVLKTFYGVSTEQALHDTPAGTISWTTGSTTVTGSGTSFTGEKMFWGSRILLGTEWRTIMSVTDATHLVIDTNPATTASGQPWQWAAGDMTSFGGLPRWARVGGNLVGIAGGGIVYCPSYGKVVALTRDYRAYSIMALAGRPVIANVIDATAAPWSGGGSSYFTQLRWPTRSDMTNWTGYGSGFLDLMDECSFIYEVVSAGAVGYAFTDGGLIILSQTGIASNPIAVSQVLPKIPPPFGTVAVGRDGLYYWSVRGPVRIANGKAEALWNFLGTDSEPVYDVSYDKVHAEYCPVIHSVCFSTPTNNTQLYYYDEDLQGFVKAHSSNPVVAVAAGPAGNLWGLSGKQILNPGETALAALTRTTDYGLTGASPNAQVTWKGIATPEGENAIKIVQRIRIDYTGTAAGAAGSIQILNENGGSTGGSPLFATVNEVVTSLYTDVNIAGQIFELRLTIPMMAKVHRVSLEYVLAGTGITP